MRVLEVVGHLGFFKGFRALGFRNVGCRNIGVSIGVSCGGVWLKLG